jgi:hypothetical protein
MKRPSASTKRFSNGFLTQTGGSMMPFHEELAGIAKECEISGKELATNPKRRRRDSLFEKEELIPSARADVTWCEGVLHGGCLCGAMRFDTTGKIFDATTVTTVAGNIAEALPY